ncbi:MAG: hypothetical protein BWK73_25510 [Thiothrix lacustris]|uniref:Uncharacterized protein n=1 Tax=Thiothrix lacustris TaxID=525917 RepID=A0A1Y1QLB0_9GAMM|nr:MAG: hypothetical protein BWK73_25510 [Thiothrix lacustris]
MYDAKLSGKATAITLCVLGLAVFTSAAKAADVDPAFICEATCSSAIADVRSRDNFEVGTAFHPMGDKHYAYVHAYSPYVGYWAFHYVWNGTEFTEDGRVPLNMEASQ